MGRTEEEYEVTYIDIEGTCNCQRLQNEFAQTMVKVHLFSQETQFVSRSYWQSSAR